MNDDELLERLAEAAREEERAERERLDPRWDELAAGRLSNEEEAALRTEAEGSTGGREALAAFAPLGADFRARMVREVRAQLDSPAPERTAGRRRTRSRARWWGAAAALAAAALLVAIWPEGEPSPLPGYEFVLEGEVRPDRAPAEPGDERSWREPRVFAAGNRFELVLRPDQAVEGEVEAGTYRQQGDALLPWPLPVETTEAGTVRIAGTVGREIELPAGETTLVVVLGRRGDLPAAEEVLSRLGAGGRSRARDWWAWRRTLARPPAAGS